MSIDPIHSIGRFLILAGALLFTVGLVLVFSKNTSLFAWVGRLPGDVRIEKDGFSFYFPWVTCIALSGLFTLLGVISRVIFK